MDFRSFENTVRLNVYKFIVETKFSQVSITQKGEKKTLIWFRLGHLENSNVYVGRNTVNGQCDVGFSISPVNP